MDDALFTFPSRSSFDSGSSDSLWSSVNKAKQERSAPGTEPLQRNDSFVSSFSSMSGDELSDEVEPWAMSTSESRFDFGFSSALRESCLYSVPREYLPSEDVDSDDGDESDIVIDTDAEGEVDNAFDSDTETVSAEEPEPTFSSPVEEREARPETTPIIFDAPAPSISVRRSARVLRNSRVNSPALPQPATPLTTKRKWHEPKGAKATPSKKMAIVGKADKPTARPSTIGYTSKAQPAWKNIKRVILRV